MCKIFENLFSRGYEVNEKYKVCSSFLNKNIWPRLIAYYRRKEMARYWERSLEFLSQ